MIILIGNILLFFCKLDLLFRRKLKTIIFNSKVVSKKGVLFYHTSNVYNISGERNKILIGENTIIRGELLIFKHGGRISIGEDCYIGENSRIWSSKQISIGNRVLISHNVNIHDNNGHPIDANERYIQFNQISRKGHPKNVIVSEKDIIIENDVWIGFNSTILKGVKIGHSSIIGSNSLVVKDVPPNVIVAGNPARIIRNI